MQERPSIRLVLLPIMQDKQRLHSKRVRLKRVEMRFLQDFLRKELRLLHLKKHSSSSVL